MIICIRIALCIYKHKIFLEGPTESRTTYAWRRKLVFWGEQGRKAHVSCMSSHLYLELKHHLHVFPIQNHGLNIKKKKAWSCLEKHTTERSKHAAEASAHPDIQALPGRPTCVFLCIRAQCWCSPPLTAFCRWLWIP